MVSFSCESCGDVLTKKKLDPHRNQCRSAVFTCLDCQKTFKGTDYRAHTACITEDQKYQGALYREKPSKAAKRKSVAVLEPTDQNALVPHQAYVEDAPDNDVPPYVPTPPSAVSKQPSDSVFDYLVEEDLPNTPKIAFSKKSREEMAMKNGASAVFTDSRSSSRNGYRNTEERQHSQQYDEHGFSYGTEPVNPRPYFDSNPSLASLDFMTPAARTTRLKLEQGRPTPGHSRTNSGSEKKRKREYTVGAVSDTPMTDVPGQLPRTEANTPAVVHSGLTGGINKMMADDDAAFNSGRSPAEGEDRGRPERDRIRRSTEKREDPTSPLKRIRHSHDDSGLGISIKGRAVKALSAVGGAFMAGQQGEMTKTRRRASSSDQGQLQRADREGEKRERKKHKVHRHNGTSSNNIRHDHRTRRRGSEDSPEAQKRKVKAIEYRKLDESVSDSDEDRRNGNAQMVVFGAEAKLKKRCEMFLSNIPGEEVGKGYSVHKALKRWHKQFDNVRSSKYEGEQELWRGLRLKRNDRGEIVISL